MIQIPLEPFYVFMLVLIRIGFVMAFFPLMGESFVPVRARILIAVAISVALAPVVPVTAAQFPGTIVGFAVMVLSEAMLGFSIGFIGKIVFAVIQFAGQIAGEQMGFGLVNAIDPTGSHQTSIVAELQYIMAILIFLTANFHHGFLAAAAASFNMIPPGDAVAGAAVKDLMMGMGTMMFALAVKFAMPIIIIVFAINVGLGMIARAVPQLNVFLESFPLRIMAGISILLLSLGFMVGQWENMMGGIDGWLVQVVKGMK
ncbi:flagellar biosynthetic protein FliR [bacterium]|nr:flagellar biosynthetic protein FliR [bacterium]